MNFHLQGNCSHQNNLVLCDHSQNYMYNWKETKWKFMTAKYFAQVEIQPHTRFMNNNISILQYHKKSGQQNIRSPPRTQALTFAHSSCRSCVQAGFSHRRWTSWHVFVVYVSFIWYKFFERHIKQNMYYFQQLPNVDYCFYHEIQTVCNDTTMAYTCM